MATYTKRKNSWRVQVCCKGVRLSASFPTKGEAQGWAVNQEHKIRTGKFKHSSKHLLDDALKKYAEQVTPLHRGERRERTFITTLRRHQLCLKRISDITPNDVSSWRDERLESVCGSSVNRELNILSAVFSVAEREWGWVDGNPVTKIRRPANSPPRHRRISVAETDAIVAELTTESERTVAIMFRLALQSAMRQAEICSIRKDHVFADYVHLPKTKNGASRNVPLTPLAQELVAELITRKPLKPEYVSSLFRRAVKKTGIINLTFHDSRHEACTMLAEMLPNPMDLAKISGHKDLRVLMSVYYNPTASDLAAKLR